MGAITSCHTSAFMRNSGICFAHHVFEALVLHHRLVETMLRYGNRYKRSQQPVTNQVFLFQ